MSYADIWSKICSIYAITDKNDVISFGERLFAELTEEDQQALRSDRYVGYIHAHNCIRSPLFLYRCVRDTYADHYVCSDHVSSIAIV